MRREVVKLHGNAAGRATESDGEVPDHGLSGIELPKAQFVIQVQNDQKFVAGPTFTDSHFADVSGWFLGRRGRI